MKISKKLLALVIAVIVVIIGIVALIISGNGNINTNNPTFMYFVTNNDVENKGTMEVVEKLKKEYAGSVTFEIKNVDEDASLLENFSIVTNKTPALIMLDKAGDISNILFEITDYTELKGVIDDTINK